MRAIDGTLSQHVVLRCQFVLSEGSLCPFRVGQIVELSVNLCEGTHSLCKFQLERRLLRMLRKPQLKQNA